MRLTRSLFIVIGVALGASYFVAAGQPKYGVTVKAVEPAALATARTYVWTESHRSGDTTLDDFIVAAVDRELTARGFTKVFSGSDVLVTYASLTRTDLDLKSKRSKAGGWREFPVATLVVDMSDPTSRRLLFRVRIDTPFETDRANYAGAVNAAVAAMFEKYPSRDKD